ncbi:Elongator complex protein 2 [Geodia barretti]|uniref:Elongator complex protein 2 n=1 Tax=Geodia barretti TaxID=519541 RepID=A0AA35R2H3_GEOBA|nr:Elongator complex protein 2 [Geodia barretti]
MHAELEYVSVGCSRTPHAVDWSGSGTVAYAAHETVALAREAEEGRGPARVFATLQGHSGRVNCVRWIPSLSSLSAELVSGGVDGKIIVWRKQKGGQFTVVQELSSHTASVNCVAGVYLLLSDREEGETPSIKTLIASASSDSTLKVWQRLNLDDEFSEVQSISFGRGFALCIDCCLLPSCSPVEPVLVTGGDDARVNIYIWNNGQFCRGLSVSGHKDWVRDVEVAREGRDLLLASCSQDASIRLWRICQQQQQDCKHKQQQEGEVEEELKLKGNTFCLSSGATVSVTLESVLIGHEDWVYSVCWWPRNSCHGTDQSDCSSADDCLQLLSSSIDKTVVLWKPDPVSGVWMEEVRVGEVGGNTLGFYGGLISPGGQLILAHDYQGGLHLWGREEKEEGEGGRSLDVWSSLPTIGGHFCGVQGLSWEPRGGAFLLSVSSDQTARLHAPWIRTGGEQRMWFEIARPQIHGYDMTCVAMTTSLQYTSGADEKVLRVFEAPANFVANLSRISREHLQKDGSDVPLGASVPSLGLSNKAVFTCGEGSEGKKITKNPFADHVPSFQPVDLTEPPVEAHLLQNTLWPETQKLYGHGYEIYCAAASPDGRYVASACKATKAEHAVIRIWEVSSWKQLQPLHHHSLTVTHLTFSPSSLFLLATSRDRTWSLWKHVGTDKNPPFQLCCSLEKSSKLHSRVIWTASWAHDDSCFATGSRDKKVLLWKRGESEEVWSVQSPPLEFQHSVTALDFSPLPTRDSRHVLSVGLESGHILLYSCSLGTMEWNLALSLDPSICHTATVKQLSWKPHNRTEDGQPESGSVLASCSHDNSVKLFRIRFCTD